MENTEIITSSSEFTIAVLRAIYNSSAQRLEMRNMTNISNQNPVVVNSQLEDPNLQPIEIQSLEQLHQQPIRVFLHTINSLLTELSYVMDSIEEECCTKPLN